MIGVRPFLVSIPFEDWLRTQGDKGLQMGPSVQSATTSLEKLTP